MGRPATVSPSPRALAQLGDAGLGVAALGVGVSDLVGDDGVVDLFAGESVGVQGEQGEELSPSFGWQFAVVAVVDAQRPKIGSSMRPGWAANRLGCSKACRDRTARLRWVVRCRLAR